MLAGLGSIPAWVDLSDLSYDVGAAYVFDQFQTLFQDLHRICPYDVIIPQCQAVTPH